MASFYWLLNRNIARQVARGMLHCAMSKKCVAVLWESLRIGNLILLGAITFATKMLRDFMLQLVISLATCATTKCETSCIV